MHPFSSLPQRCNFKRATQNIINERAKKRSHNFFPRSTINSLLLHKTSSQMRSASATFDFIFMPLQFLLYIDLNHDPIASHEKYVTCHVCHNNMHHCRCWRDEWRSWWCYYDYASLVLNLTFIHWRYASAQPNPAWKKKYFASLLTKKI